MRQVAFENVPAGCWIAANNPANLYSNLCQKDCFRVCLSTQVAAGSHGR